MMKLFQSSKILLVIMTVAIILVFTGCGLIKPSVSDAFMSKVEQTEPKYAPKENFSTYDFPYIFIKLKNASEKTIIRTVLKNLRSDEVLVDANYNFDKKNVVDGYFVIQFIAYNGKYYPLGKYQVEIYLDENLERTVDFNIQ